jgi:hypothetical protein
MHLLTGCFRNNKNCEKVVDNTIQWFERLFPIFSMHLSIEVKQMSRSIIAAPGKALQQPLQPFQ